MNIHIFYILNETYLLNITKKVLNIIFTRRFILFLDQRALIIKSLKVNNSKKIIKKLF